jgi:hypothetical protein
MFRVPLNQLAEKGWDATFWKVWEQLYLALSAQVYGLFENLFFMKFRQVFADISRGILAKIRTVSFQ